MIWRIRIALLTSVVMASAFCAVRADDKPVDDKDKKDTPAEKKAEPIAPPATPPTAMPSAGASDCGGGYRTICVTEWVPECYKTTRTVYKTECVPEKYTAYKSECVPEKYTAYKNECIPEQRTRNVTHYERVCETRPVCKTICERVCVQEERTCYKTHYTCVPVTTYVCKTVDKGHYECREVPCSQGLFSHRGGLFGGHKHDCCDSGCGCADTCCAPPTKTVQVWVPCKVTEQVPCTKMERKCETVCEKQMVNVWKSVPKTITVNETFYKCVPVCTTETYTAYVHKCVPYEATRMVSRCVPYEAIRNVSRCIPVQEEVTCTRMVAKTVQKQVPVETCNTCAAPCETSCCSKPGLRDRLSGLFASRHHGSCGCESSCGCGGGYSSGCSSCGH